MPLPRCPAAKTKGRGRSRIQTKKEPLSKLSPDRVRPSPVLSLEVRRMLDHREALVAVVREPEQHADADVVEAGPHRAVVGEQAVVVVRFWAADVLFLECRAVVGLLEEGVGSYWWYFFEGRKGRREKRGDLVEVSEKREREKRKRREREEREREERVRREREREKTKNDIFFCFSPVASRRRFYPSIALIR